MDYEDVFGEEIEIGAEVDVNPDDVEAIPPAKKKRKPSKLLKKADRDALTKMLSDLATDTSTIAAAIVNNVSQETHLRVYKDRARFWDQLSGSNTIMNTLIDVLLSLFISLYKKCQVGKDKYCRFQLKWLQECSLLLQEVCSPSASKEVNQLHPKWLQFCYDSRVDSAVSNPIIVSFCSALFDYLMDKIIKHQKAGCDDSLNSSVSNEEVGVYYRFAGAALCSMLHSRYDQLRAKDLPQLKRERVHTEITILKSIQATDKHHIPDYLQYRDKGHMYFPAARFIPFIQHVDTCVKKHANALSLQQHGANLVATATKHLQEESALKAEFIT